MADFMTFDEVIEKLQLDAEELKKMVSDEQIRAFRDGGTLKFKSEDIMALKEERETQPTIILPSEEAAVIEEEPAAEEAPVIAGIEEEPAAEEAPVIEDIEDKLIEEAPVIAGTEEELIEEAPVIAGTEGGSIEDSVILEEEPDEEAPVIAGIEEESIEEAPVIAGIEEEPAAEEAPVIADIEDKLIEEAPVIAGIEEEPLLIGEEPADATVEVPSGDAKVEATMIIDTPGVKEEPAATVEVSAPDDIELVEETSAPPGQTVGIELPDDLEEAESATVIGEEDLVMAIEEGEEEPIVEADAVAEEEEEPLVHAVSLPRTGVVVPQTHPVFIAMFIMGILVLIFAGVILVDLVREPAEIPVYLEAICDIILDR